MSIFNFIKDNYKWLFSGIGTTAVVALLALVGFGGYKLMQSLKSKNTIENSTINSPTNQGNNNSINVHSSKDDKEE